jgi:hypothetical protein
LLGLLFDSEDGGSTFLRNGGEVLPDYTALQFRRCAKVSQEPADSFKIENIYPENGDCKFHRNFAEILTNTAY